MKESGGGAMVFIASDAAFGQIRQGVYGASKAAMVAFARTTAREHGRHGIRSNIVCPGLVIPDGPEAIRVHRACGRSGWTPFSTRSRLTSCSRTRPYEG